MATGKTSIMTQSGESQILAQTYQQAMQNLTAIVDAKPVDGGVVTLQPRTLTTVNVQAGQHYKVRKLSSDGRALETPDNVVAVRHGDALHLRYADGSTASFENFYSVCTGSSVCSVNLASDSASGITLSGADASDGSVADDGLMVYAHGDHDTLMAMAQDQAGMSSAILALGDAQVLTYLPPDTHPAAIALLALGAVGAASAGIGSGTSSVSAAIAGASSAAAADVAIGTIRDAAQNNTAISSSLAASVYSAAGVTGVTASNLGAINSALDSLAVTGAQADTASEVQAIVDAYSAILASADGRAGNTATQISAQQYSTLGVTGVSGTVSPGSALFLLDNTVDASLAADVNTVLELQQMADAAARVMAAAGGSTQEANALRIEDLAALGIAGVTTNNLPAVLTAINNTMPDAAVDTQDELQRVVNTALGALGAALNQIAAAADANNASPTSPNLSVYTAAAVTGVSSSNLPEISSALDSLLVTGAQANTTVKVQTIVDAYNVILSNADGMGGNATRAPTAAQYAAIGVTGVSGTPAADLPIFLLNNAVDAMSAAGVDTVDKVQAMADAAYHVIAAAGGTSAQIAALTQADLSALGITGVTASLFPAVQMAMGATTPDTAVDTVVEIQALVNMAVNNVANALNTIRDAAQNNTATGTTPGLSVYAAAGVTGVVAGNLAAVNSALNSAAVTGAQADTAPEVQAIVDSYAAILSSADGTGGNTSIALTGAQYAAIGVTGVNGTATPGTALFLLDDVVDASVKAGVDTEPEVQSLADAAAHVMAAAGGSASQAAVLTVADFFTLGITGVTAANLAAIQASVQATAPDSAVDTKMELQALVNSAVGSIGSALAIISAAAESNSATPTSPALSVYVAAGVTGVSSTNLASINSALDSALINGAAADTTPEVQAIVDAYNAILASADGVVGNTTTPLTGAQYASVGVTGVSGPAIPGSAMFLLNNVVDALPMSGADTEAELQILADAASHVIAAAGGTQVQIAALTLPDLTALGVTGVTADNLPAVLAAIGATSPDANVDTLSELQAIVNAAAASAANALFIIRDAAQNNNATDTTPGLGIYAAAGVTGVTSADLASINSALDSAAVTGAQADTTGEVQAIVNAYNAILGSADGVADNTAVPLSGAQYTLVGVTGVSGTSAPGNALHLLDSVVDASAMPAVDTVPELQAMADAAAHVITGAAGGSAPTLTDLGALGITGVTSANLASVQAGIAATADNGTGVDTQAELQAIVTAAINSHPNISTALSGVTNLDVTSNLVLSADQTLTVGTGFIRITDIGGAGYQGDTSSNTQTIDVATAVANHLLTISGTGANTHIIINPLWDLDLASNYQITIDDGAFMNATGTQAASHIAPISFSTVTPGTHVAGTAATEAQASQTMVDATGALVAGKSWLDIQGIGNNTGAVSQLGDLSAGAYALVMKNYATQRGGDPLLGGNASDGIATRDTNVGVLNFGNNDIVYFDSQVNNSAIQFFDARYTGMTDAANVGGLAGQNALVMGLVSSPQQQGSTAMILLGLEGNAANTIYPSVVSLPDGTVGWANVWHNTSPAVIMG